MLFIFPDSDKTIIIVQLIPGWVDYRLSVRGTKRTLYIYYYTAADGPLDLDLSMYE